MLRYLLAAAIVLSARTWAQDMPVTRLAGGEPAPAVSQAPAAPARPAGGQLPPLPATQIDQRDAAASLDRAARPVAQLRRADADRRGPAAARGRHAVQPGDRSGRDRDVPRRAEAAVAARSADDAADAARSRLRDPGHDHPGDAAPRRDAAVRSQPAERPARHAADGRERRRQRDDLDDGQRRRRVRGDRRRRQVAPVGDRARATSIAARASRSSATFPSGWIAWASTSRRCSRAARGRCASRRGCSR